MKKLAFLILFAASTLAVNAQTKPLASAKKEACKKSTACCKKASKCCDDKTKMAAKTATKTNVKKTT